MNTETAYVPLTPGEVIPEDAVWFNYEGIQQCLFPGLPYNKGAWTFQLFRPVAINPAPELYEALLTAQSVLGSHELQDSKWDNARKKVRAALAKATP